MKTNKKQVIGGAMLSYILIIFNALYGMVITPYIISKLGTAEYGVYKTIAALSASLMILDLGIGGTITRYISSYKAKKLDDKITNFLAMMLFEMLIIIVVVVFMCLFVYSSIEKVYAQTFTYDQIVLSQKLFIILSCSMILHIVENFVNGIIMGNNDFLFSNGSKLLKLVLRAVLLILILLFYKSSLILVLLDLILTIVFLLVEFLWCLNKYSIRVRFEYFDKPLLLETSKYTVLMFTTSLINQLNSNLDNILVGAIIGANAVAVYSIGLTLYGMFEQISTSISGVLLPSVSTMLEGENGLENTKKLVIKVGKVQFILLSAACVGFVLLGKDFLRLWLGTGFDDAYFITLILMIPSIFTLCVNTIISILRAKNLLGVRTFILFLSTCLNAFITYFGTKKFGYYAAAIGTALSLIIGVIICINLYYYYKLKYNMLKIYLAIIGKTWIPLLISAFTVLLTKRIAFCGWLGFIFNVFVFCLIYIVFYYLVCLTKNEKKSIIKKIKNMGY